MLKLAGELYGSPVHLFVPIEPCTSTRPRVTVRFGRAQAYHAPKYKAWMKEAVEVLVDTPHKIEGEPTLVAIIDSVSTKPRTSKLAYPGPDIDNFAKGPLDACQKAEVFADDKRIPVMFAIKRWAGPGEKTGTHIYLYKVHEL